MIPKLRDYGRWWVCPVPYLYSVSRRQSLGPSQRQGHAENWEEHSITKYPTLHLYITHISDTISTIYLMRSI